MQANDTDGHLKHVPAFLLAFLMVIYGVLMAVLGHTGYYKPPHSAAFERLKLEVCAEFLRLGDMPKDLSFLSAEGEALLADPNGISATWNATEKSLQYEYDKPYEVNVSLPNILTFGLIQTGRKGTGHGQNEHSIPHNARLYRAKGIL